MNLLLIHLLYFSEREKRMIMWKHLKNFQTFAAKLLEKSDAK